jgi:Ser/Thr protein kinase RdoA (MazF antagonist)
LKKIVELLKLALKQYGLNPDTLIIKQELHPNSWHGDLHYKIVVNLKAYSARFISRKRYEQSAFVDLTDEKLTEQIKFSQYLNHSGIPFMKHCSTLNGEPFTLVSDEDKEWRFVLFEWMEGEHITHCTEVVAEKFSMMARRIHDTSSSFNSVVFERKSHLDGYQQFFQFIMYEVETSRLATPTFRFIQDYIHLASFQLKKAKTDSLNYIVQSDLNPLNILWNDREEVIGIVDFESITYTDRVEGLAWLLKWYTRTQGIGSNEMSRDLANAFLGGYKAKEILIQHDFQRLPALMWLSGCLNWNFTAKTLDLLKNNEDTLLMNHLNDYLKRGEILISLVS